MKSQAGGTVRPKKNTGNACCLQCHGPIIVSYEYLGREKTDRIFYLDINLRYHPCIQEEQPKKSELEIFNYYPSGKDVGYIYIIQCGGKYKIGRTQQHDYKTRIRQIQTPEKPEIAFLAKVSEHKTVEKKLHDVFDSRRIRNEWFLLFPVDLDLLKELFEKLNNNEAITIFTDVRTLPDELPIDRSAFIPFINKATHSCDHDHIA